MNFIVTYDDRSINLTNISEVELYQYPGPLVSVRIHKIHYTCSDSQFIEFKEYFGSSHLSKTREEATSHISELRDSILSEWNTALILMNRK